MTRQAKTEWNDETWLIAYEVIFLDSGEIMSPCARFVCNIFSFLKKDNISPTKEFFNDYSSTYIYVDSRIRKKFPSESPKKDYLFDLIAILSKGSS